MRRSWVVACKVSRVFPLNRREMPAFSMQNATCSSHSLRRSERVGRFRPAASPRRMLGTQTSRVRLVIVTTALTSSAVFRSHFIGVNVHTTVNAEARS